MVRSVLFHELLSENEKMTSYMVSLPRDLLFLIANYLLLKDQQNKLIFRYSFDWRNFINTSKEYFGEWKKQTQVIVLDSEYALKFLRLPEFSYRIIQLMEDSLHQLELHVMHTRFKTEELRSFDRVKCFSAVRCNLPKLPGIVSHLYFHECHIDEFPCDPVITKLDLEDCTIGPNRQRTVDLSTLTVAEEASFWEMELRNYQCLSSLLKSVSIERCDSIVDVTCFRNLQKIKFESCPNITM
jgi:hypothetical protein